MQNTFAYDTEATVFYSLQNTANSNTTKLNFELLLPGNDSPNSHHISRLPSKCAVPLEKIISVLPLGSSYVISMRNSTKRSDSFFKLFTIAHRSARIGKYHINNLYSKKICRNYVKGCKYILH